MAKESNRELKKQLAEAREDIQQLMLELGKVNKTANTSYEQSPAMCQILIYRTYIIIYLYTYIPIYIYNCI